jgi:hypothetical protein
VDQKESDHVRLSVTEGSAERIASRLKAGQDWVAGFEEHVHQFVTARIVENALNDRGELADPFRVRFRRLVRARRKENVLDA